MDDQISMVEAFHQRIGAPCRESPALLPGDRSRAGRLCSRLKEIIAHEHSVGPDSDELLERALLSLEELAEWLEAHVRNDLVAAADAWGDRTYALFGDAVATGFPAQAIFSEIHRSNMTKEPASSADGGKAKKGEGFERPRLAALIATPRQLVGRPDATSGG